MDIDQTAHIQNIIKIVNLYIVKCSRSKIISNLNPKEEINIENHYIAYKKGNFDTVLSETAQPLYHLR
jgi:hypothetical protein